MFDPDPNGAAALVRLQEDGTFIGCGLNKLE
jgi:hypothetical protein